MKSNLAAEKKAAAGIFLKLVSGTIATEDPTKKVLSEFKSI